MAGSHLAPFLNVPEGCPSSMQRRTELNLNVSEITVGLTTGSGCFLHFCPDEGPLAASISESRALRTYKGKSTATWEPPHAHPAPPRKRRTLRPVQWFPGLR